nr:hypothetical protein [Saccharothrix deserti]
MCKILRSASVSAVEAAGLVDSGALGLGSARSKPTCRRRLRRPILLARLGIRHFASASRSAGFILAEDVESVVAHTLVIEPVGNSLSGVMSTPLFGLAMPTAPISTCPSSVTPVTVPGMG